jgi:hypothetical protein
MRNSLQEMKGTLWLCSTVWKYSPCQKKGSKSDSNQRWAEAVLLQLITFLQILGSFRKLFAAIVEIKESGSVILVGMSRKEDLESHFDQFDIRMTLKAPETPEQFGSLQYS